MRATVGPMTSLARRACTLLRVLLVAVAVVAMHSLGAGHGPPMAGHPAAGGSHVAAPSHPTGDCTPGCLTPDESGTGHLMGAMCLAVLSSLLALVLLTARRSRASRVPTDASRTSRRVIAPSRAPPRRLALDLSQVCVLRT